MATICHTEAISGFVMMMTYLRVIIRGRERGRGKGREGGRGRGRESQGQRRIIIRFRLID